jgi:hypothetical protein
MYKPHCDIRKHMAGTSWHGMGGTNILDTSCGYISVRRNIQENTRIIAI